MGIVQSTWNTLGAGTEVFPTPVYKKVDPGNLDTNYPLLQLWLNTVDLKLWALVKKQASGIGIIPTWQLLSSGGGGLISLTADSGGALVGNLGNINVVGGTLVSTVGTPTDNLQINLERGANGEIIIGKTGANPEYGQLTSQDDSVAITVDVSTSGSFTIDLAVDSEYVDMFVPSEGDSPIEPNASTLNLTAGANMRTIGTNPDTITFALVADVNTNSYSTQASDSAKYLVWTNRTITGTGSDTNIDVALAPKGTGNVTSTNSYVATNPIAVSSGGTGVASTTEYSVLCGGTTTTAPLQSVATVGTSGQVLTSNGPAALPTWQNATGVADIGFFAYRNAVLLSLNGNSGPIPYDTERFDIGSNFASDTFTAPDEGLYSFHFTALVNPSRNGVYCAFIRTSRGGADVGTYYENRVIDNSSYEIQVTALIYLDQGDTVWTETFADQPMDYTLGGVVTQGGINFITTYFSGAKV